MNKIKYILLLIFIPLAGFTQENFKIGQRYEPVYSQYWVNGLAINPAYAGSRECFSNIILYRNQWMGFEGAPITQTLSSHLPLKDEKNAVGLFLFHEEIGVSNYYDIYGNYAFRFQLGNGKISLGLRAGVTLFQGNYTDIQANPEETVMDEVFLENESELFPNAGFGAYYYSDKFYLGVSVPKLLSYEVESSTKKMSVSPNNYDFLLTMGYLYSFSEKVRVKPSVLFRYRLDGTLQFDGSLNLIFIDAIWFGGSIRDKAWVMMAEYQATDQIRAGVAYDFPTGDFASQHSGSLEVILRYDFKYKIRATNPRYF